MTVIPRKCNSFTAKYAVNKGAIRRMADRLAPDLAMRELDCVKPCVGGRPLRVPAWRFADAFRPSHCGFFLLQNAPPMVSNR
jgi:hypothetical protein